MHHTHIVRFLFFFIHKNKAVVANAFSSEESSILWSRAIYKNLADRNRSCDIKYRPIKVSQLFSADNIGQLLSVVCHALLLFRISEPLVGL